MFFHWGPRPTFAHFEEFEFCQEGGTNANVTPPLSRSAHRIYIGGLPKIPTPLIKNLDKQKKMVTYLAFI